MSDLTDRYCMAMALICDNKTLDGLTHLLLIINAYNSKDDWNDSTKEIQRFIGYCALQLAGISEHNRQVIDILYFNAFCSIGARTAKLIGQNIGDKFLENESDKFLNRLINNYLKPYSPISLQVEPTNQCNLNCSMCPRKIMTREIGFLDMVLWLDILDGWKNKYVEYPITHLVNGNIIKFVRQGVVKLFFMGEPLLHPKIDQLITTGREKGCIIGIQTNGKLLKNPEIRFKLLSSMPSDIAISLDGFNINSYEKIRHGNKWKDIIRSLSNLYKEREIMGLKETVKLKISAILPDMSKDSFDKPKELLNELKNFVDAILYIELDRGYGPDFWDNDGKIKKYSKIIHDKYDINTPICSEALEKLNVLWDGRVTPCCYDVDGKITLGDVKKSTIDEIWNNEKTNSLHYSLVNHNIKEYPLCISCRGQQ